jgi:hypothetical protein
MVADTGLGSSIIPQNCMPVVQMVSKLWSINLQFKMVTGCILDFNFHHVLHPYRFSDLYLPSCLFWSLQHSHLRFWVFIVLAQMYDLQDLESRFKVIQGQTSKLPWTHWVWYLYVAHASHRFISHCFIATQGLPQFRKWMAFRILLQVKKSKLKVDLNLQGFLYVFHTHYGPVYHQYVTVHAYNGRQTDRLMGIGSTNVLQHIWSSNKLFFIYFIYPLNG